MSYHTISIHAPLTGSDLKYGRLEGDWKISIHAPLTGSDGDFFAPAKNILKFQSTLPLRGATLALYPKVPSSGYFNPRSPYGERPWETNCPLWSSKISIHAPLTGSDIPFKSLNMILPISIHAPLTGSDDFRRDVYEAMEEFQSTLPLRGATSLESN